MKNDSINIWQTGIILFILIFANKILLLPSLFYNEAKVEGVFCYLFLFLLELFLITLFVFLKRKYPNSSFSSLIREKLGVVTLKIFYVLFLLYFFCKLVLIYNITYIFFKDLIYKDNDAFLYVICIFPIINFLAVSKMRVFGRTAQIFFPLIFIILLISIVLSFIGTKSTPLLFQGSFSSIFIGSFKHISSFDDSVFLIIFFDKIDYKKKDGKKLFFMSVFAMILTLLIVISFYLSYTYTSFMHPYAIFEVLGNIKDYGGLGRVDVISVILVIFLTYLQMGLYLKCFTESFLVVFPKLSNVYALVSFDIAFFFVVELVIRNLEKTVLYGQSVLPYFSLVSFGLVPIFSILFLLMKKKEKSDGKT